MAEAAAVLQAQINAAVVAALAAQAAAIVPAECMSSLFSLLFPQMIAALRLLSDPPDHPYLSDS
jgi:hypothetical protein